MTGHDGIRVNVCNYKDGYIYAEITPAYQPWWRRLLPSVRFWWVEVTSVDKNGFGTHHWQQDTGAYTLAGAIRKAERAIDDAVDEL